MKRLHVKLRHRMKRLIALVAPWSDIARHRRVMRDRAARLAPVHAIDTHAMLDDAQRAIEAGRPLRAELALAAARRSAPTNGRMIELAARAALLRGRAHDAVERLERDPTPDDRRRLLLALARCQSGDVAGARLELAAWSRKKDCPAEARVMLATLELAAGDEDAARDALGPHRTRPDHPLTCQMLILLDTAEDLPLAAEQAASTLATVFAGVASSRMNRRWLATLGLTPRTVRVEPDPQQIVRLARSLTDEYEAIPALVRAQRIDPQPMQLRLLRRAMMRIVDDVVEPMVVLEALAELAEVDGDHDDAMRWARRALRIDAYAAKMALLMDRIAGDDAAEANESTVALERVGLAHPEYRDVQRALSARKERAA